MNLAPALAVLLATQAPFVETIEVRLHNVDVIVTDRDGKPVYGLTKDDFELLEDGKAQKITNFAAYDDAAAETPAESGGSAAPLQKPPPRKLVFFVDDMSVHPQTRQKLVKSAVELLEKTMRADDEAVVVRPGAKIALDFSGDREAIRSALTKAIGESSYRTNVAFAAEWRRFQWEASQAIDEKERRQIARRHAAKVKRRVENRLAALRGVVATLAPLSGRKVLVTITESLPSKPGREFFAMNTGDLAIGEGNFDTPSDALRSDYVDMTPAIEELARIASSSGITIYGLQPEYDLRVSPAGGDASVQQVQEAMTNTADTMNALTGKTGGKWFAGEARVGEAMRTIEQDVQSWYSLAYRAGDTFDRAHHVEVRVRNHPQYSVRARNEVTRRSPAREMTDRVVAALVTTTVPNDLRIAARAGTPKKSKRGAYTVDVDVFVRIGAFTLLRDGNMYRGKFTVHYAITGSDADFVSGIEPEQVIEIPVAESDAARAKIWRHTLHVEMDSKDRQIAVGVLDGISQASGIATLNVEIP